MTRKRGNAAKSLSPLASDAYGNAHRCNLHFAKDHRLLVSLSKVLHMV
jgi:hypothetical protein